SQTWRSRRRAGAAKSGEAEDGCAGAGVADGEPAGAIARTEGAASSGPDAAAEGGASNAGGGSQGRANET
ncbi:MAG: hypothetical protein J0H57_09545, partial [Rhodospirillales bacterium]|nr:hypothetical protein [Rhodospirillales bacterium]